MSWDRKHSLSWACKYHSELNCGASSFQTPGHVVNECMNENVYYIYAIWCINTSIQSHAWSSDPFIWAGHRLLLSLASVLCLNSTSSVHRIWYLQLILAEFINVGFDFFRDGIIITNRLLFLKADRLETEWTSWMSPHVSRPTFQNYSLSIMTSTVLFADMFLDLGGWRLGRYL